jgi:hypothetical protein
MHQRLTTCISSLTCRSATSETLHVVISEIQLCTPSKIHQRYPCGQCSSGSACACRQRSSGSAPATYTVHGQTYIHTPRGGQKRYDEGARQGWGRGGAGSGRGEAEDKEGSDGGGVGPGLPLPMGGVAIDGAPHIEDADLRRPVEGLGFRVLGFGFGLGFRVCIDGSQYTGRWGL